MKTNPFRWGILGCARIARNAFIPAVAESDCGVVAAVASRDAGRAGEFAAAHGIPRAYGSYEELLADPDIDAVYNPLPASLHAEWSIRAAEAGRPVLCEKPFASNAAEASAMAAAFERAGVPVMEAFMYRFHPMTETTLALVREGAIGAVRFIRATFHARIADPEDIRFRPELGGGALLDVGTYCVSLARLIAGAEPSEVHAVGRFGPDNGVDEHLAGLLAFPSGPLACLACSLKAPFDCSYDITGDHGRIRSDHGGMVPWPGTEFRLRVWRGDAEETIVIPPANHYRRMVDHFAEAVRGVVPLRYAADDAVRNMEVIDRLLAGAAESGR